jgi:hypothetical protein
MDATHERGVSLVLLIVDFDRSTRALFLASLVTVVTACSSARSGGAARAPSMGPAAAGAPGGLTAPLVPLPPPSPLALLASASATVMNRVTELPCPPPGLPPEVAGTVDCAAMKRFAAAAAFAPRQVTAASLPVAVDLRAHRLAGPMKDQEQVGACAGFAISSVLDNALRRVGRGEVISPLHVFATYARKGDLSRTLLDRPMTIEPVFAWQAPKACAFANDHNGEHCRAKYGVEPGSVDRDPTLQADQARADASGRLKIIGYEEMPGDPDQLAVVLASGEAIYAAFRVDVDLWSNMGRGQDVLPYYPAESAPTGHAVALEGYRPGPNGRQFLMHNSWGREWARDGYAWIEESMVRTHLMNAYRVEAVDAAVPTLPRNLPPAAWPLPAQASWGSARDAVSQLLQGSGVALPSLPAGAAAGTAGGPAMPLTPAALQGLDAWLRAAAAPR